MSTFDPLVDQLPSRYVVGIDLGTTNSAVTYIDTQASPWKIRVLDVPQLVAPGEVEARDTLPSFHFQPVATSAGESSQPASASLQLPWDCLLYTSPSPRDGLLSRMPSSA